MADVKMTAKDPATLKRAELVDIVQRLQATLYLDMDEDSREFWNLRKEIGGSDFIDVTADIFDHYGLVPVEGPKEWRPKRRGGR